MVTSFPYQRHALMMAQSMAMTSDIWSLIHHLTSEGHSSRQWVGVQKVTKATRVTRAKLVLRVHKANRGQRETLVMLDHKVPKETLVRKGHRDHKARSDQLAHKAQPDIPSASDSVPLMDGVATSGSSEGYARSDHAHPTDTSRAPTSHASTATTYGKGTSSSYGHVKLSDSTSSSTAAASGGTAATPKAVKDALDAAKAYVDDKAEDYVLKADIESITNSDIDTIVSS